MVISNEELFDQAVAWSTNVEDTFLDLGRSLRKLLDRDPEMFSQLWQKSSLGRRKAYYLVEVSRAFDPLPVARSRLKKLGWTKLQILAKHVTKSNVQELLALAEGCKNAKQLEAHMRGEKPVDNAHCVLMYFSPKQYKVLEEALLKNGARRSGRGFLNKEAALTRALKKLNDQHDGAKPSAALE